MLAERYSLRSVYYGWWIVLASAISMALMAGPFFHGAGTFLAALDEEFGWSRTLLAGAFAFSRVEGSVVGPIAGFLTDRLQPPRMVLIGFGTMGLGFGLFSLITNPVIFYVAFITIAVGAGFGAFIPLMTAVNNWFTTRRSTAMALAMSGTSAGGLIVGPMAWAMGEFGWRPVSLGIGIIIFLASIPVSYVLRRRPGGATAEPTADRGSRAEEDDAPAVDEVEFTLKEALRTRAFWFLAISHTATNMSLAAIIVHGVPHLTDMDLSLQVAGTVVTLYTAISLAFQLLAGYLGDRLSKRYMLFVFIGLQGIAVLLFAFTFTAIQAILFGVLFGVGFGGRAPLMHALRADYFGRKSFATITGIYNVPLNLGMVAAPLIVGFLFDLQGTYQYGMFLMGAINLLGAVLILGARQPHFNRAAPTPPW